MDVAEMSAWLEEADPETSAFEISRESFTELVKYMQTLTAELTSAKEEIERLNVKAKAQKRSSVEKCTDCIFADRSALNRAENAENALVMERKEVKTLQDNLSA